MAEAFALQLMATEDAQLKLFQAGGRPPALRSALDRVTAVSPEAKGFAASGENGTPFPPIPEVGDVWSSWTDAYTLIFNRRQAAVEVFKDTAKKMRAKVAQG
jgi:arabinogalactan oligomer / maltooligosaccharide transport system substrate-binding protein